MPTPPVAAKHPVTRTLHGDTFIDDYFWLREKDTEPVLSHLRAEAAYTDAVMAPFAGVIESLFNEIVTHIAEDDASVPVEDGGWLTWRRIAKGQSYPVHLRSRPLAKSGAPSSEEVVLDVEALAKGKAFLGIGDFEVSDDGETLLYSTDETGFREFDLRFRDIATQRDLTFMKDGAPQAETIPKVVVATWATKDTVLYIVEDDAKRPYRLYRHTLSTDPATDTLVYEEADARFEMECWRSRDHRHVIIESASKLTTEVRLVSAANPKASPHLVLPRKDGHEYHVETAGDRLFIRTNDRGHNFRLVEAALASSADVFRWKELRAHDPAVMLDDVHAFKGRLVLEVREQALPQLEVVDLAKRTTTRIPMREEVFEVSLEQNPSFDAPTLRLSYQSLATPRSVLAYDFATGAITTLKVDPVPGGFDPARYRTERLWVTATDGTRIPVSLVSRKDVPRDGSAPLHLYAYGSYGLSMPTMFSPARLTLLDRGVVYAIAHIRGGGELGKGWHEDGRLAHKMNTFTDFIACAEALVKGGYTSPQRLTIEGRSAGGLLMGAVLNLRPDLFKAAIVGVPFVDVVNTMNDPSLPLTITEYEEWGNPGIAEQYGWIRPYSPYDNLAAKAYPSMLVETSYHDSQVMYWEPAKYVARLRALKTDPNPLVFRIHLGAAGHGGKSGRYDRFREVAFDQAYLLWQDGVLTRGPDGAWRLP
ncbi:MAG: S9 family peptidase [Deltaproteobacteria bacterium]|nr:S9 family peptidase [Deltaproteobacteria bacterium]